MHRARRTPSTCTVYVSTFSVSSLHHMLTLSPFLPPLPLPQHVFAVVRSPQNATQLQALADASSNVHVVKGDFEDVASLKVRYVLRIP